MFKMLGHLAKAAVGVVIAPVAIAADIVTLPAAIEPENKPFNRTGNVMKAIGKNVTKAME